MAVQAYSCMYVTAMKFEMGKFLGSPPLNKLHSSSKKICFKVFFLLKLLPLNEKLQPKAAIFHPFLRT